MAQRPYWKGYLKLSLVNCPVQMVPATSDGDKVRFHTLNRKTKNRIVSRYVDAVTGRPVDEDDEAKGYQRSENEFLILEEDELDAIALESVRTIDIEMFSPHDSIHWIWLERPYYLSPSDPIGEEAFSVIRDAMAATEMVGISRLVVGGRERAVMLEPRDKGIVLWTLRFRDEVRDEKGYFANTPERSDDELMPLVQQLIKERVRHWKPEMTTDPVQEELLQIIAQKKKERGKTVKRKPALEERPAETGNVINIMDALRQSLKGERRKGR